MVAMIEVYVDGIDSQYAFLVHAQGSVRERDVARLVVRSRACTRRRPSLQRLQLHDPDR